MIQAESVVNGPRRDSDEIDQNKIELDGAQVGGIIREGGGEEETDRRTGQAEQAVPEAPGDPGERAVFAVGFIRIRSEYRSK